jgi:hypothetical protein
MAKPGLKATPAQLVPKVLRATSVKLENKALQVLVAKWVKREHKATWGRPAHKVILAHKVPKEIMARLVRMATPVPQVPLGVKVPSATPVWMATRAQPDKRVPTVLAAKRVSAGLSAQPA